MVIGIEIPDVRIRRVLAAGYHRQWGWGSWASEYTPLPEPTYLSFSIRERGDGEVDVVHTRGTLDVQHGLQLMARESPAAFAQLLDDRSSDATTGNVLMQYVLFGEQRYA